MTKADIVVVIGTSLEVYPAASLVEFTPDNTPIFVINPGDCGMDDVILIHDPATIGVPKFIELLKQM
jgi:NAD-dependent deacetylase